MQQTATTSCERCAAPLSYGQLVCPSCGALVYARRLNEIAAEAMGREASDPSAAAMIWRQALDLLPPDSQQYAIVYQRIGALAAGWSGAPTTQPGQWMPGAPNTGTRRVPLPAAQPGQWMPGAPEVPSAQPARVVRPPDPLPLALLKTVGSMVVSIAVYYLLVFHNFPIARGFVVLMLVHEMGHVLAMRYYGLSASPPIFIPFLGALINLRQSPPNALVESVVGIGGPLLGAIGAIACYLIALATRGHLQTGSDFWWVIQFALFLNLFNLLPVPPLDGGRVTAAISPWLWLPGLAGLDVMIYYQAQRGGACALVIPVLILLYALPRVRLTLRARGMNLPYYRVSRKASWTMGAIYVGLSVVLTVMFLKLEGRLFLRQIGF